MNFEIRFSKSVLEDLAKKVAEGKPAISSEIGDLFLLEKIPLGAISLKIPLAEYLTRFEKMDNKTRPRRMDIIPQENGPFQIVVNQYVTIKDGKTFIDDKEVNLL